MTFAFAQPLKLLAIGGSLITSSSLWFFRPHPPLPIQTRSSTAASSRERDDNINTFDPVPKLDSYTPEESEFDVQITSPTVNNSSKDVIFTHNGKEKKLDYTTWDKIENFQLGNIMGLRSQYKDISKDTIKIYLFKNPAWFSSTNTDEFETTPIAPEKIEELFTDIDETKTKQLLLSLRKRRNWYKFQDQGILTHYIARIPQLVNTSDPGELTNLKVKYFYDFNTLKDYVHKKVKESCTNDFEACIAHPEELTFLKADSLKYFSE